MKRRSEPEGMGPSLRDKVIGLGDRSTRKSYYPQLRQQLEKAEEDRSRLEDRSAALLNMLEDLEETRRSLADSQARYRSLVENISDVIFSLDVEGGVTYVSPVIQGLSGLTPDEIVGRPFLELVHSDDRPALSAVVERALAGQPEQHEFRLLGKDGGSRCVRASSRPLMEEGRVVGLTCVMSDITERKRAEEALRESEAGLREAQRLAGIGSWDWDTETDTITWSEEYYRIYGIDPTQHPPGYEDHLKAYTPESAAQLDAAVQKNTKTGESYEVDLELAHTGGPARWVTARSETRRDAEGRIIGLRGTAQDITERRRAEEALRESERSLKAAQRIARLGSWTLDIVNDTLLWSDEIYRMFEIDPTELGASYETFLGAIHPEDREAVDLAYTDSLKTRTPYSIDHRLLFPDGRVKYVHEECETTYDEKGDPIRSTGTVQDVTERKLGEEALRESQQRLALHLEQTLLGVIEWDTEFRVTEWNPAAEAVFGYSREEVIGHNASDLILSKARRPEIDALFDHLVQQKASEFSTGENVTKDGRTILCEWVNTPLVDENGTVVGGMSLARDVTERRQAEELRIAKEAAERANTAKSSFLANMSHEIRTPMNAILGFSQLMRRDKGLSERQRQQLDVINTSGEHLLALINDVLEMSKVEAGRISANLSAFSLRSLLHEMDSLFGLRAEAKGLGLRVVCSDEVPEFVVTDENKLRQILVNLLGNAVKFTDKGNIELRVTTRRRDGGKLRLVVEVADTGRGIAPEDMGRLFQYFEQAAPGREADTGTGLGLAISREFVHLLGGEIGVDSQPDVGSVFRFDIAIEEASVEDVAGGAEERHVVGLGPGEPRYRVLVADDAPDNRELLVQLLEPVGFNVRSVADGKAALEEFEEWHPQLILMDMRMPVMDGYEATRRIRATPVGADIAIIGVTASAFAEMRQGVFDAGVDEFIGKPFHESELFDKVAKLLGAHYVYEETSAPEPETEGALNPEALAALPGDLVDRIRQATINADFDAVLELADEVARTDRLLAMALRSSAGRFDSERILAALPGGEGS